ncbi:MAG: hypothetical protein K0U54_11505, partial [Bacteroidetes bacterium]|nr:hypothetical protein [Bacteroidota bacterium]
IKEIFQMNSEVIVLITSNMRTHTNNIYLLKALDAYPYELEKAAEAINYALSYEPDNVQALCLMGRMQSEQLKDYEAAKHFFELAIASNMDYKEIYPDYIRLLLQNEDLEAAQKLIDFSLTIKGVDRAGIKLVQGQLFEIRMEYVASEAALDEALALGLNNGFISYVEDELARVTKKRERHNREKAKASKTEGPVAASNNRWRNRLNSLL